MVNVIVQFILFGILVLVPQTLLAISVKDCDKTIESLIFAAVWHDEIDISKPYFEGYPLKSSNDIRLQIPNAKIHLLGKGADGFVYRIHLKNVQSELLKTFWPKLPESLEDEFELDITALNYLFSLNKHKHQKNRFRFGHIIKIDRENRMYFLDDIRGFNMNDYLMSEDLSRQAVRNLRKLYNKKVQNLFKDLRSRGQFDAQAETDAYYYDDIEFNNWTIRIPDLHPILITPSNVILNPDSLEMTVNDPF
jgi:hypothetical protein